MRPRARRLTALTLGFAAGLATGFAISEPQAAQSAQLGSCAAECGPPTPCCMLLWYAWCGCWFDDEEQVY
jgi:hypothetical protein